MTPCTRCLPPAPQMREGILCLAPPLAHTQGRIRRLLDERAVPFAEPAPNILSVRVEAPELGRLATALDGLLSQAELRDTRCVVLAEGADLGLADLARMMPLATLIAKLQGEWLAELLEGERLTTHFQAIVHAGDPARVFAHECLLRGVQEDGGLISPGRMYDVARAADLMFPLDRAARLCAIRSAVALGLGEDTRLFINFNPVSIYDPAYCLRSTMGAIREGQIRARQIVFEVVESDKVEDVPHLLNIVSFYRNAGFAIALDDLGSGYGSLNLLGELRPDFVKLDMRLIRDVARDPYKAGITRKLLEMARELGIATIAEGVETEEEWDWVRENGADFVQGYLFSRPSNPPAEPAVPAPRLATAASPA